MPDTQVTELAGRHYLISQLLAGGVEVAMPLRDRGIDLIAYLDKTEDHEFVACPIQLKANEGSRFGVHQKYASIPNLLLVYAWNVSSTEPELYALTYSEAVELLTQRKHTETRSWKELGGYSLAVNETWRELLKSFRMRPEMWCEKLQELARRPANGVVDSV